ncbi:6473_t:CDS:2 [Rhizophagus irregularis]|nr:6473_t:CDS:2 [Rhizophagus irregularis]
MSTPTIIATENLVEEMESWGLHHATYWSSDLNSWGSVSDWDVYFIDKTPGCTKDEAHRSLSLELNILLKKLSDRSRQYSKANALKKALENSDNDSANILLWNKHLKELESIAISDLVHRVSHYQKYYYTRRNWTSQRADIREIKKNKASTKECEISSSSSSSKNDENYNKQEDDDAIISGMLQVNVCYKFITLPMHIFSDLGNDLREASESMVGKANDEPPKTPEHQIYQKQGDYSKPFASCEEQSHGFHSSEISQNLGDSIESNDHDSDEDEFGLKNMNLFKQSLVHSFIIDTEDTFIKDEFSEEELSEIVEKNKEQSIPEIDEEILEYIDTFAKKSTKEIREALNTPHPLLGRNYDPHTNFIYDYIRTTVTDW